MINVSLFELVKNDMHVCVSNSELPIYILDIATVLNIHLLTIYVSAMYCMFESSANIP
jgi:hypothetical protein